MKSNCSLLLDNIKKSIVFMDYAFWFLADISKFKDINKKEIKKVIIIHLGSIGEILQTTPIFPSLKKELGCDISFMVGKDKESVLKNNPYISEILIPEDSLKENIDKLKKRNFDLAIILYPATFKINLICLLAKIKYRIGCFPIVKGGPSFFLTKRIFPPQLNKKDVLEGGLEIIRMIGIDNKNPRFEFYLTDEEHKNRERILESLKVKEYIIVHPGGSFVTKYKYPARLWNTDRFAVVIDYLIEKYEFNVFLTGNIDEKVLTEAIYKKIKNKDKIIISNELFDIRGLASLIFKAKLLISSGTGIVHIASAFNIPSVIFEGRGNPPKEVYPITKNTIHLFHPEVCTGCNKNYCRKKSQDCMKAITIKEVKNAADKLLKKLKK